jgi:hypothetical protein
LREDVAAIGAHQFGRFLDAPTDFATDVNVGHERQQPDGARVAEDRAAG